MYHGRNERGAEVLLGHPRNRDHLRASRCAAENLDVPFWYIEPTRERGHDLRVGRAVDRRRCDGELERTFANTSNLRLLRARFGQNRDQDAVVFLADLQRLDVRCYVLSTMGHFRFLTAGESHGPCVVAIVEGCVAGLGLLASDVDADLARRQRGYGRGGRMKIERDKVEILGGIRDGKTLGSPIALRIENKDFASWTTRMGAGPLPVRPERLERPRPGHADLAGGLKYDRPDLRDILERASARETAARTAVGAVARRLLEEVGVEIYAHVTRIGPVTIDPSAIDPKQIRSVARSSDLACADPRAEEKMRDAIRAAAHDGDTLGGEISVIATGAPVGLGSHVHWDRKLDGRLSQSLMSIQAIKGVSIGDGFAVAARRGSTVHDPIVYTDAFHRTSNHAGGIEGGMSNGEPIVCNVAMKPIATLKRPLASVHIDTKEALDAAFERSDVCAVAAASVVAEAAVAVVLADALLEKFGSDSLGELLRNITGYRKQLARFPEGATS
ncbi:chorismate synthase [soil metagenome]